MMELKGSFKDNIFIFEEYKIGNQKTEEGRQWCYKSAELTLKKEGDKFKLDGPWTGYVPYLGQNTPASLVHSP
ncbi:MAG: hypothetical protein K2X86_04780 [Cytophagaceae bacterium]|nr:hypothetical protein [Cytophagaceae bacterium]